MGNLLPEDTVKGTYGELLMILRLLDFDVQACFTLKDSGNDLIAVKGTCMRTIQVKSTGIKQWGKLNELEEKIYDILALVSFKSKNPPFKLDSANIYLLTKAELKADGRNTIIENDKIKKYHMNKKIIQKLFSKEIEALEDNHLS